MMQLVSDPGTSLFTQVLATNHFRHLAPALVEAHRKAPCTFSPVPLDILDAYPTVEALSQDDAVQTKAGIADVASTEICIVEVNHAANKRRSQRKEQQHAPLARMSNQRLLAWRRIRAESPMLPQAPQAAQTRPESAVPKIRARPKKKKAQGSWAYRAWTGRGASRDERGRWRTCKAEFRSAMASSDAARIGDMAAIMEVRHAMSRPLKRPRQRSPEIRRFGRQRLRALRVGGAIPAIRPAQATSSADLSDFRHATL